MNLRSSWFILPITNFRFTTEVGSQLLTLLRDMLMFKGVSSANMEGMAIQVLRHQLNMLSNM